MASKYSAGVKLFLSGHENNKTKVEQLINKLNKFIKNKNNSRKVKVINIFAVNIEYIGIIENILIELQSGKCIKTIYMNLQGNTCQRNELYNKCISELLNYIQS